MLSNDERKMMYFVFKERVAANDLEDKKHKNNDKNVTFLRNRFQLICFFLENVNKQTKKYLDYYSKTLIQSQQKLFK